MLATSAIARPPLFGDALGVLTPGVYLDSTLDKRIVEIIQRARAAASGRRPEDRHGSPSIGIPPILL
jgi:hypothetical protein